MRKPLGSRINKVSLFRGAVWLTAGVALFVMYLIAWKLVDMTDVPSGTDSRVRRLKRVNSGNSHVLQDTGSGQNFQSRKFPTSS